MCDVMINKNTDLRIAVIDADLIGRKRHRFPNLACMKISGYWKEKGAYVELKEDYEYLEHYDKVYISKVFTDTEVPEHILELENVEYGGTGFFFDKAPNLPDEIEHHMPDYHLYDSFVDRMIKLGVKKTELKEYTDYSIGFLTRGCFRKCGFCVNKKYDKVFCHSPLDEFYDASRKKICLLDDNFLGQPNWKPMLQELIATGKPFKFKQGLDERLLTDEKCEMLFNAKYDGQITFAFDKIEDYDLIHEKLKMIRRCTDKQCTFYVLCGFDKNGVYDENFWRQDMIDTFERIKLIASYKCIPYIMRFEKWKESPNRGMYITLARWCNQPSMFKKNSILTYCRDVKSNGVGRSAHNYLMEFKDKYPDLYEKYCDMSWLTLNS